jgi:hypothetical protein
MRIASAVLVGKPERKDHLRDIGVGGSMKLKFFLNK